MIQYKYMKPEQSKEKLIELMKDKGFEIEKINLEKGFSLISDFYENTRSENCGIDQDGDMLLFQWRFLPNESKYEIDIVRQFTLSDLDADDRMSQLHFIFNFPISENISSIPDGDIWCHSLEEISEFNKDVNNNKVYEILKSISPISAQINYELV